MKLESTISLQASSVKEVDRLRELFRTEDTSLAHGRSGYRIDVNGTTVTFVASADDPTALRAVLSAITKVLTVYAKMDLDSTS